MRTLTLGHSMSAAESISPEAFAVVALDEVLKRSRADVLRILLEPHPASSTAMPDNTAALTFARICFIFSTAIFVSRFLAPPSRQPRCQAGSSTIGMTRPLNQHHL